MCMKWFSFVVNLYKSVSIVNERIELCALSCLGSNSLVLRDVTNGSAATEGKEEKYKAESPACVARWLNVNL